MGKKRLAVVFILIMLCITAAICVFADGERNDTDEGRSRF